MTPAEVREAAALLADDAATRARGCVEAAEWLTDLASDIRALPLAEEAPDVGALARATAKEWQAYSDDPSLLVPHEEFIDALTALLNATAEGWDVVEEGEGDEEH